MLDREISVLNVTTCVRLPRPSKRARSSEDDAPAVYSAQVIDFA